MRTSKILRVYLKNFIIHNYSKIFLFKKNDVTLNLEIYLNLTSIKLINKNLWCLVLNYPSEIIYEMHKNLKKLLLIINSRDKYLKKLSNFNIFIFSHENINTLYQKNINFKFYKKLIISNLKIISQSKKQIKLIKIKIFCKKCMRILNLKFDNTYQTISFLKLNILIHNNKHCPKCIKNSIYFIKNSSIFIFEKFIKCQYTPHIKKMFNDLITLMGITYHTSVFSLLTGYIYELVGILDVYKEHSIISETKKIFITIKILGLNLYRNLNKYTRSNLISNLYVLAKANNFLTKTKTFIFQNISGFEILKKVISCLLFINHQVYKKTSINISEKIILGFSAYSGFYNLLTNRILNLPYLSAFVNFIKIKKTYNHEINKKMFINLFITKFKNKHKNILIFEKNEFTNNIFYDFLHEINEKDNYILIMNDHYIQFETSFAIITYLNQKIYYNLSYILYKKTNNIINESLNIFKYYDLIFDIKKNIFSNTVFEKNTFVFFSNLSFFKPANQKMQHIITKKFDFFLIIQKLKNLEIAYFTEYSIKYTMKIYKTVLVIKKFNKGTVIMGAKNLKVILKLSKLITKSNLSIYIKKKTIDESFKITGYSQTNFWNPSISRKFKPIRINYYKIIKKLILNIFFKFNILSIGKLFITLRKLNIPVSYSNYVILTFLINRKLNMLGNYLKINNNYNVVNLLIREKY
uniref:Uncharacterized protein n=1 Tax=Lotharella vacuolata TaxID=74820 RepID=A0A0H5BK17_9EUKA|nr:hypothetical protein [Lotharella vacuolata]